MKPAVFLDRDGTVIVDRNYLATVDGVELLPEAGPALARLAAAGFVLVIITNQSGVGRGLIDAGVVTRQHQRLTQMLAEYEAPVAGFEVCPHCPDDNCCCRKPAPLLLQRAADRLGLNLTRSFMIGDKESDVAAGRAAGCRTIRLGTQTEASAADYVAADLSAAADLIINLSNHNSQGEKA